MSFLLISILSSSLILVIFKLIGQLGISSARVIVVNYLVAALLGLMLTNVREFSLAGVSGRFVLMAFVIGVLFIVMFHIISHSSRKAGIGVTGVSAKISVIFPILFSILIDPADKLSMLKSLGISLALAGVFMTVYKEDALRTDRSRIVLPLILFAGMGFVDSLIRYSQYRFVSDGNLALFTTILFAISFFTGFMASVMHKNGFKQLIKFRVMLWGFLLGMVNFGSIYFLIRALNSESIHGQLLDGSVVFGINNVGIVGLSTFFGVFFFREKLSYVNRTGIFISISAIIVLAYSL